MRPQQALLWTAGIVFAASFSQPVWQEIERGQADLLTLLFVTLAAWLWLGCKRPGEAAACLVIAAVFKPPVLFLLTVPLLCGEMRAWRASAIAGLILIVLSLLLTGPALNARYVLDYLPRIAAERPITPPLSETAPITPPSGATTVWQGRRYITAAAFDAPNGSVARLFGPDFPRPKALRLCAAGFLGVFLVLFLALRQPGRATAGIRDVRREAWVLTMLAALCFHPLTWCMGYVWLLFCVPTLMASGEPRIATLTCVVAAIVALPVVSDCLAPRIAGQHDCLAGLTLLALTLLLIGLKATHHPNRNAAS